LTSLPSRRFHPGVPGFKQIGLALALAAVFSLAGGHWLVLQAVAWAQMTVEYSQEQGLAAGLEKTFSGKSPCKLCRKVQEGRQQEEHLPALVKAEKKAEVLLEDSPLPAVFRASSPFSYPPAPAAAFDSRREAPLPPVPILPVC
jgi:hypothetical protein